MEKFYCLSMNGDLCALGNHQDWETAEDTAHQLSLSPVWVFGEQTFNDWRQFLNNEHEQANKEATA